MPEPRTSFNLLDEPWIIVQTLDDRIESVGLLEAFERAPQIRQILGDLPTQTFAITRLLLAILHRALGDLFTEESWGRHWQDGLLPSSEVNAYLHRHEDRFDLLDQRYPFFQVADLRTPKGEFTELARLIGDAPTGHQYLTMRLREHLDAIPFAEAARWVVTCQAFDTSGIKSGAEGDSRVKGGKGYPIGMGAAGHIGGVFAVGRNLAETLLLNYIPYTFRYYPRDASVDFAPWERPDIYRPNPLHAEDPLLPRAIEGVAELYTWQSRRIRLEHDGHHVRGVLICNGDRFFSVNQNRVEPMTAWRISAPQAKKLNIAEALMPRAHDPSREFWRGLGGILPTADPTSGLPPALVTWLAFVAERYLPETLVPTLRAIGVHYVTNSSVVGEIYDDQVPLPVRILQESRSDLQQAIVENVGRTEEAVQAYAALAVNLFNAAGGSTAPENKAPVRDRARAEAYAAFDPEFRRWIKSLQDPNVTYFDAMESWSQIAYELMRGLARQAVDDAGHPAWLGRDVQGKFLDSGLASTFFHSSLSKIFPPKESS
jgi:CRISPR system Cascade subunit CasA